MENKKLHSLPILKEKRATLRKNLTPAEAKLWTSLKNSQLQNRKFIRQHSIEKYIVGPQKVTLGFSNKDL
jgi:very-short-patch-repair endonuclease